MLLNFSWLEEGQIAGMGQPRHEDLDLIYEQGIRAIISLTERPMDEESVLGRGMNYLHIPISDMQSPTLSDVIKFVDFTEAQIREACPVMAHCGAGIGRTGTMLACFLVGRQYTPGEALAIVRMRRPGSVETLAQEAMVYEFAKYANGLIHHVVSQN